jgi:hypothetical protein
MVKVKENSNGFFGFLHEQIASMNNSKFFAGIVIISLNIASKFVTIKLSKSTESYLKYTFSRQILIFCMAWMATRDIYMALILTAVFVILADYLFNEKSCFCCLSDDFKHKYLNMDIAAATSAATGTQPLPPNHDEIKHAIELLEQVKRQNEENTAPNYMVSFGKY